MADVTAGPSTITSTSNNSNGHAPAYTGGIAADPDLLGEPDAPWERLYHESEDNRWYSRFLLYRDLGPLRRLRAAVHAEDTREHRPLSKYVNPAWKQACQRFRWKARAEAWDEYMRKQVYSAGLASALTRIQILNNLGVKLASKADEMIGDMKPSKGGYNERLVANLLDTLEALALETGGRVQRKDITASAGPLVEVLHYLPEQEPLPDPRAVPTYTHDDLRDATVVALDSIIDEDEAARV